MKKTILLLMVAIAFASCEKIKNETKPEEPVNPIIDKGHEEWGKIVMTFTNTNDLSEQKIEFVSESGSPKASTQEPIVWKIKEKYHLELEYFNTSGNRMNNEFVTPEMARIHQHFFLLGGAKDGRFFELRAENGQKITKDLIEYTYKDTDPEEASWKDQNVKIRKASWNKINPEQPDPIGLKGIFDIKTDREMETQLRVVLAHFLVKNKLKEEVEFYPFYEFPSASFFTSDLNLVINVKIVK